MTQQKIPATALERLYIKRRIDAANLAETIAGEVFSMFCEGHGIPGATFVGIDGDSVIVAVLDAETSETGAREGSVTP